MAHFIDESEDNTTNEEVSNIVEDQQQQLEEPVADNQTQEEELPERYKGKSIAEVVRMHQEAEKLMGRHSKEVGELRRIVDDFVKTQSVTKQAPQEEEIDFFSDPQRAVEQAVARHPKIKEAETLNAQLARQNALQQLQAAHPDYQAVLNDEGFSAWVAKSKVRSELLSRADQNYDFDAADDLLSTWKELKQATAREQTIQQQDRKQQIKQASTGAVRGSGEQASKKKYRRSDIMDLMRNNPNRYMELQPEIMKAYAEGRVIS